MTMPYVELGPDGMRFLRDVAALGLVVPFDWQAWLAGPMGAAYREDRSRIADAPPDDIVRLVTSIVRATGSPRASCSTRTRPGCSGRSPVVSRGELAG